jgi:DNA end-binding protein Ku
VQRSDLVKGYEIEKNRYVILTNEEIAEVKLETTHTLDIERFVDEGEIDRLFWNDPYYLLPSEKSGVEAYAVIRDAMNATGRVALGRVVMHTRERLMAVEPRGRGLIAYSLRTRDEVLDVDGAFKDLPATKPDKKMIEIAEQIIAQQAGPFQPELFEDRYENALRELIKLKEKGKRPVTVEPPKDTNVIDLMDALRKSLKGKPAKSMPARAKPARTKKSKSRILFSSELAPLVDGLLGRAHRLVVVPRLALAEQRHRGADREAFRIESFLHLPPIERHRDSGAGASARRKRSHSRRGFVVAQIIEEDLSAAIFLRHGDEIFVGIVVRHLRTYAPRERLGFRPTDPIRLGKRRHDVKAFAAGRFAEGGKRERFQTLL